MLKFKLFRSGNCLSQELMSPVLGSSSRIQPKVVARLGRTKETQKKNSKLYAKGMLVRASNQAVKIPNGNAMSCSTIPILTLFQRDNHIPRSLKASRHALRP